MCSPSCGRSLDNRSENWRRPGLLLNRTPTADKTDSVRALVEEKLGPAPVEIDELVRQCGVPAAEVLTILLELELAGRVQRHPGNRIAWR